MSADLVDSCHNEMKIPKCRHHRQKGTCIYIASALECMISNAAFRDLNFICATVNWDRMSVRVSLKKQEYPEYLESSQ